MNTASELVTNSKGYRLFRWSRRNYVRLFRFGMLGDDKCELIGGVIETMSPQMLPHAIAISMTTRLLQAAFGEKYLVLPQTTLNLGPGCMPDPDVLVVNAVGPNVPKTYPADPHLVVEVSESTLRRDRRRKGNMYAKHGITEYWIVNLHDLQLEVYRDPVTDAKARFGWKFGTAIILKPGQSVSPLALPTASIPVADMFPS